MRLLTLNTHSLLEKSYEEKCTIFADAAAKLRPDVIALQEVNQSVCAKPVHTTLCGSIPLKEDNHALKITRMLSERQADHYFTWLGIKCGYGRFDEGLAFLSRAPIEYEEAVLISKSDNYTDWRTRKALIIKTGGMNFCTSHLGWWDDEKEPFAAQFEKLNSHLLKYEQMYLLGDFNAPADKKGEGYSLVLEKGWYDTFALANEKDDGFTVSGDIAGWEENAGGKLRIDYIFSKQKVCVKKSRVVFDGKNEQRVSDHFGVMIDIKEGVL